MIPSQLEVVRCIHNLYYLGISTSNLGINLINIHSVVESIIEAVWIFSHLLLLVVLVLVGTWHWGKRTRNFNLRVPRCQGGNRDIYLDT
jgi:hypothetical protein